MSEVADIQTLVLGAQRQPVQFNLPDGRQFVVLPDGEGSYKLEQITLANAAEVLMPKVIGQHVKMQTAGSLIDYLNRFKNDDSVLFADIERDTIAAVIDYHNAPSGNVVPVKRDPNLAAAAGAVDSRGAARLAVHRATLALPKSLEWQTWTAASGVLKSHTAFATFLEENAADVVSPPGADLLELCRDLQVIQNVKFGSAVRMGAVTELHYSKEADATSKGTIALPPSIMLSIPVYFGEPRVNIMAFFRRQIEDGKLKLGLQLSRAENVGQDEFHRIVDEVKAGVDHLTTVYGTPA